jgi:hypothetical protein
MSADTVLDMLAERADMGPLIAPLPCRQEVVEPLVTKVYTMWITPEGLPAFPIPVEAFSVAEARELATKAAPHLPAVGRRPFNVSGRAA